MYLCQLKKNLSLLHFRRSPSFVEIGFVKGKKKKSSNTEVNIKGG